jgi:hypothetical protein
LVVVVDFGWTFLCCTKSFLLPLLLLQTIHYSM